MFVFEAYINGVKLTALLGSGASHLFTSQNIAKQCGLTSDSSTHEEVELGDSSCVSTKGKATATLRIGDIEIKEDIHLLDMEIPSDGIQIAIMWELVYAQQATRMWGTVAPLNWRARPRQGFI